MFGVLLVAGAAFAEPRPGWIKPKDGVRFPARDVVADRTLPLPAIGRGFYLFTRSALDRPQIAALERDGLRYLGPVASMTYAFIREAGDGASLRSERNVIGTAPASPLDRLEADVLPHRSADRLPLPIWISFWPRATRAEVLAVVPEAAERMRLPATSNAPLMEGSLLKLGAADGAALRRIAASPIVAAIGFIHPKKLHNSASRALSNADAIIAAPYNLDGTGVLVGHWDGGSVSQHPDFQGRVDNHENAGVSDHATHTAGTILGAGLSDSDARGYAPMATMIAYDFYGDAGGERREAKHTYYHEHDNHSWGSTSSEYGGYDEGAREFDLDSRDLFLIGVKAAGNEGQSSQVVDNNYGFDSLPPDSTSKNVIVICATDDDGDLAGFSSRGPTNDGRVKPDICANGVNVYSTYPGGDYGPMSGTSMATPSATGLITLLAQLYKREHGHRWAPDLLHAVLIHTATDVFHPGPDYRFGWGNANAKAAADLILADAGRPGQLIARGAVRDQETMEYELDVPTGSPELKVTLYWLDAYMAGTAHRRLLNDIDLELVAPSGAAKMPWTLDASGPFQDAVRTTKNDVDNVEQVLVEDPEAGKWIVRVKGAGITDPDLDVQGYVIATSLPLSRALLRVTPAIPSGGQIPDGDPTGLEIPIEVSDPREVVALRVHLEAQHEARGNLRIEIQHPDGTKAAIETEDQSTRYDIFAIYPDTRSYAEDVAPLYGKPAQGTWIVRVIDLNAGSTGQVVDVMLEIDFDGTTPPPPNTPPIANAGKDETVMAGQTVTLDGSRSFDPDGDPLAYAWSQSTGMQVVLTGATTATATFVAPEHPDTRTYVFSLGVDDRRGGVATDDVIIHVLGTDPGSVPNQPPIARTNGDQMVKPGVTVRLDASSSTDPDGDPLSFRWSRVSGAEVELTSLDAAATTFVAPESQAAQTAVFRVEVSDGRGGIDLDDVTITIDPNAPDTPNVPPTAPPSTEVLVNGIGGGCACSASERATAPWGLVGLALWLIRRSRR